MNTPGRAWLLLSGGSLLLSLGCDVQVGDGTSGPFGDAGIAAPDASAPDGDTGLAGDAAVPDQAVADQGAGDQAVEPLPTGVAPASLLPEALALADGPTAVSLLAGAARLYRVEVPAGEHVGFRLTYTPTSARVIMTVERYDGVGPAFLGLTDGGRGIRTLAVFEPDAAHTYWVRLESDDSLSGTLDLARTPFADGEVCTADCDRLLQLPLPLDPSVDGYDWTSGTVMRYQFGRRDLLMLVRFAGQSMAAAGFAPFYPEDFSQWDGETPGTDTGSLRHASHQRGKDVDISLYGTDGEAPWRSYCQVMYVDGRECVPGTVSGYDGYLNARMFGAFYQSGRVTRAFLDRELIYPTRDGADDAVADGTLAASLRPLYSDGVRLQHWPNHNNHIHVRVSEESYPAADAKRRTGARFQVSAGEFEAP